MSINNFTLSQTGLAGVLPNSIYLNFNNASEPWTTTGYLNSFVQQNGAIPLPCHAALGFPDTGANVTIVSAEVVNRSGNWSLIAI